MSRISFTTEDESGRKLEIVGGWDPPLRYYHFTIYDLSKSEEEEGNLVYDCLNQPDTFATHNNDKYFKVLTEMGIIAPPGFWEFCDRKEGGIIVKFGFYKMNI